MKTKYKKSSKPDYMKLTRFLKDTTHLTAREWFIARLCANFKNARGQSETTWIGKNLPQLVPVIKESYTRQEVSNARAAFKKKVLRSGTTFFYAYYAGLVSMDEMIEAVHKVSENIKLLREADNAVIPENLGVEVQKEVAEVLRRINESINP
ncbi:MAG TPA: hypothetical protein HA257_05660 [Candidatus Methanoperedenaceae archaeon]|nr:hypothetical protein [Candidatus Methanoperedenaceae archaeon]